MRTIEHTHGASKMGQTTYKDLEILSNNYTFFNTNVTSSRIQETTIILGYVAVVLYLLTFIFGVLGNSLTIFVILRNKRMKTVATCFILNLAIADDLFMLSLPFLAYNTFTGNWIFGSWMCTIMSALYRINLYASIFTMVLMSIDRYLAIVHPLSSIRYRTIKNAVGVCCAIWAACCIVMTPVWMYSRTEPKQPSGYRCTEYYPKHQIYQHKYFMTNFELLIGFVFPISIMVCCYLKLLRHLIADKVLAQDQTRRPIRKVTVMVFIVTLVFVICWTPYHIVKYTDVQRHHEVLHGATPTEDQIIQHAIFNTIAQALVFLSSCCNPFIYGISSRNFRKDLQC